MSETEVLSVLARMFPSFRGLPPQEATRRGEALGLFSVRAWAAGSQAMHGKGIAVPPEVHARLAQTAAQVAQAGRGGLQFIAYMRQGFADDAKFAGAMTGLARVYAESLRGAPAAQAAPAQAAPASSSAPVEVVPGLSVGAPLALADDAPLDLAPAPPPRTAAPPPQLAPPVASTFDELDLAEDEAPSRLPSYEEMLFSQDADASSEEAVAGDPLQRAFQRYENGDLNALAEAEATLRKELAEAPHVMAAAFAEAGLGKVALLRGDRVSAEKHASQALKHHSTNPLAVEVLVRCMRGEAQDAKFSTSMRTLRAALVSRDPDSITRAAQGMATDFPGEPFPYLAMMMVANMKSDRAGVERFLRQAWGTYPSQNHADRTFGGEVDADVLDVMLAFGREPLNSMDEDGLRATVEDVDSKENVIAGSLRMSAGLARVAITHSGLTRPTRRRLFYSIGKAMMGLQYFEEAPAIMGKALMISPTDEETRDVGKERVKCQALWRAFDKPGIKAQKRFNCMGARAMSQMVKERLDTIREDRGNRQQSLWDRAPGVLDRATKDPRVGGEIADAAEEAMVPNPMEHIGDLDRQLAALSPAAKAAPKEEKKGFFGKLKAAADTVSSAAVGAANKIKESQLQTKRQEAIRKLATDFARDLSDYQFKDPELLAFAQEAQVHEAFVDYFATEEGRWQKRLQKLAEGGTQA